MKYKNYREYCDVRDQLPSEERQIEALEQISDSLVRLDLTLGRIARATEQT